MSCLFGNPKISEDIRISSDVSRYPLVSRILTGDPEPRSGYVCPTFMCLSCLHYGISLGNKKPANVERDYIVLLTNLIEEGTVQCIVE